MSETKISAPEIEFSLKRLDYHWIEISPKEFGEMLAEKLKAVGAKAFLLDVYCSNNSVYRSLQVKWEAFDSVKTLHFKFNREEGKCISVFFEK